VRQDPQNAESPKEKNDYHNLPRRWWRQELPRLGACVFLPAGTACAPEAPKPNPPTPSPSLPSPPFRQGWPMPASAHSKPTSLDATMRRGAFTTPPILRSRTGSPHSTPSQRSSNPRPPWPWTVYCVRRVSESIVFIATSTVSSVSSIGILQTLVSGNVKKELQ
jgi:hypothetical protein